jgi:uncharacterized membrane protein
MQCNTCGTELDERNGTCPRCHIKSGKVQILSPEERENFNGITIEQDNGNKRTDQSGSSFRKVFVFQLASVGAMLKLIISGLLLIAVTLFFPLSLLLIAILGFNWLSNRNR